MRKILIWGSPHQPTAEQLAELQSFGKVVYLKEVHPELFNELTNIQFDTDLEALANKCCDELDRSSVFVQFAGNPAFHVTLGRVVISRGDLWFAHSNRESVDQPQADGSVRKVAVFRHVGWTKV